MNIMEQLIALERRIAALEANRAPSLRFAEVTEVDKAGKARVKLLDGDDMISHPLRTVQRRTLKDKDQCFPDIGEHVAVLFSGQGLEQGVVLGAVYSDANVTDGEDSHVGYYRYEDGTSMYYDREAHRYVADVKGDIKLTAEKTVEVEAKEDVTVTTQKNAVVQASENATIKSGNTLFFEGATGIRLRAPSIGFEGMTGGACRATIQADLSIKGNISQQGNQTTNGSINASGPIIGNPVYGCRY